VVVGSEAYYQLGKVIDIGIGFTVAEYGGPPGSPRERIESWEGSEETDTYVIDGAALLRANLARGKYVGVGIGKFTADSDRRKSYGGYRSFGSGTSYHAFAGIRTNKRLLKGTIWAELRMSYMPANSDARGYVQEAFTDINFGSFGLNVGLLF